MRRLLIEIRESATLALSSIAAHKLRSGLTLLGVLVGVFSIILVMTAMRAMQNNIENQLGGLGSKTFAMQKMPGIFFGGGRDTMMKFYRRRDIDYPVAKRFQQKADFAPFIGLHANFNNREVTSVHGKTPPNVSIEGATTGVFGTNQWTITEGRSLLESDIEAARDLCVLNDVVARVLFPHGSAIGQRIKLASIPYTVVGVFERATSGDNESRGIVVLPITTGLNRYGRWAEISILVSVEDAAQFADTVEQARGLLRAIRKVPPGDDDDFEILTSAALIEQFEKVTRTVRLGLTFVSSIALLAAGVGIMNIMLVSVTERTREIGIRRALGARRSSILTQFLMEAVVLCQLGGLLGIASGLTGARLLAVYFLHLPPAYPIDWTILALVICSIVGLVFGSYPAWKAAHLDPIDALRHE
ncbi:MAG: ABC transporter permease [Chthoniobacter sp.]|uniref:ABC transporter permease n=1 Tax=Chthoniobacter sp. TaxID=2510640 RepID=UPI0032A38E1B